MKRANWTSTNLSLLTRSLDSRSEVPGAECLKERLARSDRAGNLSRRRVDQVGTPDDLIDALIGIIHHHGQLIGEDAVGAQQDHVVQLGVLDRDLALHGVLDHGLALARRLEADGRFDILRRDDELGPRISRNQAA